MSEAQKQRPNKLLLMLWFDKKIYLMLMFVISECSPLKKWNDEINFVLIFLCEMAMANVPQIILTFYDLLPILIFSHT